MGAKIQMSVPEFRDWYREQDPQERSQLAKIAAEELGCELKEESDENIKTE